MFERRMFIKTNLKLADNCHRIDDFDQCDPSNQ